MYMNLTNEEKERKKERKKKWVNKTIECDP
jgi:hypothetical protein